MSAALAVVCAFIIYGLAFRFYARHLGRRVYALDDQRRTPAHALEDGVDFVPTNRFVLFGHHWASITGLAPMLGPAVAVIWGWGPAMLWVVLGAVLVGCVHDFSALVVSMRARGVSIGKVAEGVIGPRAKLLFLLIIFFLVGARFTEEEKQYDIQLPSSQNVQPLTGTPDALVINVRRGGTILLGSLAVTLEELESELRDAKENFEGQAVVVRGEGQGLYQPVIDVATEKIVGFEVLTRWDHPTRGRISPDVFIPIAEEANLISRMGEWILRSACAQIAVWPGKLRIAVNVSPTQFAPVVVLPVAVVKHLAPTCLTDLTQRVEIDQNVPHQAGLTSCRTLPLPSVGYAEAMVVESSL